MLATGQLDEETEGARTLPTDVSHAIARAFADEPDGFHNVVELARTLAPFAPPGHSSARTIAFILSRAGIVSSTIPLKERSSLTPSPSRLAQTVAPPDRSNFTEEWFRRGARTSFVVPDSRPVI